MEPTTTRPRKSAWKYVLTVLLALIALTACAWSVVALANSASLIGQARQQFSPSPVDLARQANRLRWLELWGNLWSPLSVILVGLLVLFLIALAWTLLRWLSEKATAQYADGRSGIAMTWRRCSSWPMAIPFRRSPSGCTSRIAPCVAAWSGFGAGSGLHLTRRRWSRQGGKD